MRKSTEYCLAIQDVIYLLKCALNETAPEEGRLQCRSADTVFAAARRHMLTAAVAMALEAGGIKSEASSQAIASAMRKSIIFGNTLSEVEAKLNAAGIWYMPLKGIVLKDLYPRYGMREMADHDILIDPGRAGDVKLIMESLGFTTKTFGASNHDVYYKQPVLNFEMHTGLFGDSHEQRIKDYYHGVGDRLVRVSEFERRFTDEDFYIYMIAHEHKHYSGGGTGLRSLADTYIYLKKHDLDMDYVICETEKLGLREYEAANRSLAVHLFGNGELAEVHFENRELTEAHPFENGELTAEDREMLEYILSSGTYGTMTHRVENNLKKAGGNKLRYMLGRFFVPVRRSNRAYKSYAGAYPLFYKHKILLPLLPFYRTIRAIKRGAFIEEAKAIKNAKY